MSVVSAAHPTWVVGSCRHRGWTEPSFRWASGVLLALHTCATSCRCWPERRANRHCDKGLANRLWPPSCCALMAACFFCRQGTVDKNGVRAYKWMKKGLQANYYYSTADALQLPVELDQASCRLQLSLWAASRPKALCAFHCQGVMRHSFAMDGWPSGSTGHANPLRCTFSTIPHHHPLPLPMCAVAQRLHAAAP